MPSAGNASHARAVVIGAGMGGLAAAIRLAAAGCQVTVIETAEGPGGKARSRASEAGPVAMGPTVLTLRAEVDALFRLCGSRTEDELDLVALPLLARHWWPGSGPLDLHPDRDANIEAIRAFAGQAEAEGFARFDARTRALYAAFEAPVMQSSRPDLRAILQATLSRPAIWAPLLPGMTLDRWLGQFFRDPRLRQLFGRYATYVGGRPARTPAVLGLIWQAEAQGVWAARDGIHALAEALARAAIRLGVVFRYATRARRIVRQSGRVSAVEIEGGTRLACDIAVFNGDPRALAEGQLGDAPRAAMPRLALPKPSLSAWVWSFAARAVGPTAAALRHHNLFFTADPAQEFGPIGRGLMPAAPTLYLCAQDRELGPAPPVERFQIIMNGPADHQASKDEDQACQDRCFPHLRNLGLGFSPPPTAAWLTRPSDLATRFPGSKGAIYGQSPEGMMAAFRRPTARTRLPGLYLAGGGVHPGAGVPMALISGRQASAQALSDLTSGSLSDRTAMPGGTSTASRRMDRKPSR